MRGVPELWLVVEAEEGWVRGARTENSRELLVQGPDELVQVDIGVGGGRGDGEGGTLFVEDGLEACHIWRIGDADWPILVSRNQTLKLHSHQACQT